jgi:hypothetical protein
MSLAVTMNSAQSQMQPRKSSASFKALLFKPFWLLAHYLPAANAMYLIVIAALLILSGCSGLRIVDSQVSAFSTLPAAPLAGAAWAFERLPSQQNLEGSADIRRSKLEAAAQQQLAAVGFAAQPSPAAQAQFTVQVAASTQRLARGPFDDPEPWGYFGSGWRGLPGRDYVVTGSGRVIYTPVHPPFAPRYNPPWFVREVSLIIRDAKSKAVVYETQAKHEGNWADEEAVLPAMLQAALQGFPKPPEGKRMVNIEIPR